MSKIILDTCAILYTELKPDLLSSHIKEVLQSDESEIYISSMSCAEIACGWGKRFELKKHWRPWFRETISENGWNIIPVDYDIIEEAYSLPEPFHKDPVDRILVATSRLKQIPLVTNDKLITDYPYVKVFW